MKAYEKLERLTRLMHRTAVCEAAGLGRATLQNILARQTGLRGETAVALAKVLGVDAGWLIDDSKEWPPVRVGQEESCTAA